MNMNKRWMILILLMLGALIVSGCGLSREARTAYDDAKDTLQKAIAAGAKKCAPCQIATAEAALAHAEHEMAEMSPESHSTHFWAGVADRGRKYYLAAESFGACLHRIAGSNFVHQGRLDDSLRYTRADRRQLRGYRRELSQLLGVD